MKGIHKGKRCFIIATGPSLTIEDLEALKDEYTISMNSISLVFDKTSFRPTYYMMQDKTVMDKVGKGFGGLAPESVFIGIGNVGGFCGSATQLADMKECPHVNLYHNDTAYMFYNLNFQHEKFKPQFSDDCYKRICDGTTVTFSAIQFAAYMGFSEIYLVGTDYNYKGKKRHFAEYDESGDYTDLADIMHMKQCRSYKYARDTLEKRGVKLCNATRGGMLEELPRVSLDELL